MKKIAFYIPAILFIIVFGWMGMTIGIGPISPLILVWIALFLGGGLALSKGKFWGGILGMFPGIYFIYASTKFTGQMFSERPIGIAVLIFYMICSGYVLSKGNKMRA